MINDFIELLAKEGVSPLFAGFLAATAATFGALASLVVSGRTVYINSVTAERSRWIEKLRANIGKLSTAIIYLHISMNAESLDDSSKDRVHAKTVELLEAVSSLGLQLNPNGVIDGNVLKIVELIINAVEDKNRLDEAHGLLMTHSRWLLKEEWEKVKAEASGPLSKIWWRWKRSLRLRRYRKYAAAEGNIQRVLGSGSFLTGRV